MRKHRITKGQKGIHEVRRARIATIRTAKAARG